MQAMEKLSAHLKNRLVDLTRAKAEGRKIIGYTPGGYLPEELVIASGAIPVGFIRGGDHSMVEMSSAYLCRWIDTFCRGQIGYAVSGEDPYYRIIDVLVVPMTDNHIRAVMDVLDYNTDIEVFPYGVPHMKDALAAEYYLKGIARLRKMLEELTGKKISDSRLREAIELCNRERTLLKEISLMRRGKAVPLSSRDFVALNHGSFIADKRVMVEVLEQLVTELKEKPAPTPDGPRILLTGSTLALGDNKVHDLVDEAGGVIVIEEFAEGIRPYWENVNPDGDPMAALADAYFNRRIPPAWFRPGRERLDFLVKLARDFKVDGVMWYQLMYRESYKTESYYFPDILDRETGLSMMVLESDYDAAEVGQMRTRVETFVESIGV